MSPDNKPPGSKGDSSEAEPPRRRAWQSPAPQRSANPPSPPPPVKAVPAAPATSSRPAPATSARPAPAKTIPVTPTPAPLSKLATPRTQSEFAAQPAPPPSSARTPPGAPSKDQAFTPPSTPPPAGPPSAPGHANPAQAATRHRGSFRVPRRNHSPALVSRGEQALFWSLLAAVLAMSIFLVRYRAQVDAHFQSRAMAVPLAAAATHSPSPFQLLLYLANDDTGTLTERPLAFPLPDDPNTRARVVLEKLLSEYTAPASQHPLKAAAPGVEAVDEVYLVPIAGSTEKSIPHPTPNPAAASSASMHSATPRADSRALLAVVDLTPNFVHTHPSGIEPETLTLLSMIATLHANLPAVTEVRFLVDGEPRATLAGHADIARTYLAGAAQMAPPEAFTNSATQRTAQP